jgi:ubiquinone/menaquinone biosynthesis C-methylase UbiE
MGHGHEHGHGHGHQAHGPYDRHRNPVDFERYLGKLESPDREAWQMPDRVVEALALRPGDVACDVGAGPGYLALRMARAVGPTGDVYAIDVDPRMIEVIGRRLRESGIENVHPVLARPGRAALPPRRCRVILVVNAFHHFPDGAAYLRRLAGRLTHDGRIVIVDFRRKELPVGPPPEHKISRAEVAAEARRAGLEVVRERRFLPYQYFLELAPVRAPARGRAAGKARGPAKAARRSPPRGQAAGARRRAAPSTR